MFPLVIYLFCTYAHTRGARTLLVFPFTAMSLSAVSSSTISLKMTLICRPPLLESGSIIMGLGMTYKKLMSFWFVFATMWVTYPPITPKIGIIISLFGTQKKVDQNTYIWFPYEDQLVEDTKMLRFTWIKLDQLTCLSFPTWFGSFVPIHSGIR